MSSIELIGYTTIGYFLIGITISLYYAIFKTNKYRNWDEMVFGSVVMSFNWLLVIICGVLE